jgi:hypothetical protein
MDGGLDVRPMITSEEGAGLLECDQTAAGNAEPNQRRDVYRSSETFRCALEQRTIALLRFLRQRDLGVDDFLETLQRLRARQHAAVDEERRRAGDTHL